MGLLLKMFIYSASLLVLAFTPNALSQATCGAGTLCINSLNDVVCEPCDAGTTCRPWVTASGTIGNFYCQFDACLLEGTVCSGRVGTCCAGLACGRVTDDAADRTCFLDTTTTTTTTTTTASTTTVTTTAPPSGACMTISGNVPNAACVFPFTFNGTQYTRCTTAGGFSSPWCSRQTAAAPMCRASGVTVTQTPAQAVLGADHQEEAAVEEDQEEDLEEDLVEDLVDDLGENKTNLF